MGSTQDTHEYRDVQPPRLHDRDAIMKLKWPVCLSALFLALLSSAGCSHPFSLLSSSGTAGDTRPLPFGRVSDPGGISPTSALPQKGIPLGTAITVRLQSPLSSADSTSGDSFTAQLDDPIVVAGKVVAERGSSVLGRIAIAKASSQKDDPGYLRLTLSSVVIQGKPRALQTSSLFSKGGPAAEGHSEYETGIGSESSDQANDAKFSTARRLTFHLVQPVILPD